ncbi:MAG: hypothetical protein WCI51_12965 [Lentisphaerota bacterium]
MENKKAESGKQNREFRHQKSGFKTRQKLFKKKEFFAKIIKTKAEQGELL